VIDANAQRRAAYEMAVARRDEAGAALIRATDQMADVDARREAIAGESASVQAERLRLIQTRDRALEVVEELRDRTARYEVAKRMWADATGNRRIAEAMLADVRAAQAEMRAINAEYVEATRDRDDIALVEAMFHRDGLPTLLLELTIPLVEARANELLLRMPGELNLELVTQKATKKGSLTDTLDVAVTKRGRPIAYGMASGAERFRIDLALRLGLAGVLLHRTGAQFATLWLDEPFAAQDAEALEALLQSVAAVVDEFGFTFVTTHQREVAERFPVRIEVSEGAMQMAKVRIVA
jgi:exonuclease SbcC